MNDPLAYRIAELGPRIAALNLPGAGLVPGCEGAGHQVGRQPVGHILYEEQEEEDGTHVQTAR